MPTEAELDSEPDHSSEGKLKYSSLLTEWLRKEKTVFLDSMIAEANHSFGKHICCRFYFIGIKSTPILYYGTSKIGEKDLQQLELKQLHFPPVSYSFIPYPYCDPLQFFIRILIKVAELDFIKNRYCACGCVCTLLQHIYNYNLLL